MSHRKKLLLLFSFLCLLTTVKAQETYITVATKPENPKNIQMKVFHSEVVFRSGLNFYRQEENSGNWKKLNAKPIFTGTFAIPDTAINNDSSLLYYKNMADAFVKSPDKKLLGTFILMKSVLSNLFASYLGICFEDTAAKAGVKYQYMAKKLDAKGESVLAVSEAIQSGLSVPEKNLGSISVKAEGDKKVKLIWPLDHMKYFAYNIYRYDFQKSVWEKINNLPVVASESPNPKDKKNDYTWADEHLKQNTLVMYKVKGINYFGYETAYFTSPQLMLSDRTPPPAPSGFQLKINTKKVLLAWDFGNTTDVNRLVLFRKKGYYGSFSELTELPPSSVKYTDSVFSTGKYYYKLASADSAGNLAYSYEIEADVPDITPPKAPKNLIAKADTGIIRLSWAANTDPDLLGYRIYRTVVTDKDAFYVLLNENPVRGTSFVDKLPRNAGNKFYYKIAAIDSSYNMSEYSFASWARMPDVTPPEMPQISNIEKSESGAVISFAPNAEPDLEGYQLFRKELNDSNNMYKKVNIKTISPGLTEYTDKWIPAGISCSYYLVAEDSSGNTSQPSKPYILEQEKSISNKALAIKNFKARKRNKRVELSWSADNTDKLEGYIVFRKAENGSLQPLSGLLKKEKFTDTSADSAVYQYKLKAFTSDGTVSESENIDIDTSK